MKKLILLLLIFTGVACETDLEKETFNVYFYSADSNREEYLGEAQGLNQCQTMIQYKVRNIDSYSKDWDYVCCLKTSSSSCAEKHR